MIYFASEARHSILEHFKAVAARKGVLAVKRQGAIELSTAHSEFGCDVYIIEDVVPRHTPRFLIPRGRLCVCN